MPTSRRAAAKSSPPTPSRLSAPQRAMRRLGLVQPIDLALHVPLRYEDETQLTPLAQAQVGSTLQFEAEVVASEVVFRGRRQWLLWVDDGQARCVLRFLHFFPSQQKAWPVGRRVRVRGELRRSARGHEMVHPQLRDPTEPLAQALTPVYPTTQELPQAYLRKAVAGALARAAMDEVLPPACWHALGLDAHWTLRRALNFLHQPPPDAPTEALQNRQHPAWQRLKAEEMLAQLIAQRRARAARQSQHAIALRASARHGLVQALMQQLPFALTDAQTRVLREIATDLARDVPMHRLLQGDVGCGKTVVAALAACVAIEAGAQCALMAPTEILARQHFVKLTQWLQPLLAARGQTVAWLIGAQGKAERRTMQAQVHTGQAALVVGTQALIQDDVQFARLGLVVVDEQHRFGVAQRLTLRQKTAHGEQPHLLMMTATPIPRTLAMTLLSDLDISTIDTLPPGRTPVVTKVVEARRRHELMARLRAQLEAGRQAYWVCPLIEESEALDLRHATQVYQELAQALGHPLPDEGQPPSPHAGPVGLLHGRQTAGEKKAMMDAFVAGTLRVLVSTTVIEVGVDVPNASLMVIEHAERFGLSQLHQLRGRVGRGSAASVCVLLYEAPLGEVARARLQAMAQTHDGFVLAQTDLRLRGPGELLGSRQSGAGMLRFADAAADEALAQWAREQADWLLAEHPDMATRHVQRWLGARAGYLDA